jgi:LPS export ABC transporter protein LptC
MLNVGSMKQQQPGLAINIRHNGLSSYKQVFYLLIAFVFLLPGCKNDLEKIQLFSEEAMIPNLSGKNVQVLRSDSGLLKFKLVAPEIKRYDNVEDPFVEFPKGIDIYFLDSVQQVKTHITAKYAIQYTEQHLYYARDSVVAENTETGEWISSEEMYWDEKKGIVYSEKFTTIQRTDGIYYGRKGFEAQQDFSSWKLKKPQATLNIDNEGSEE